MPNGLNVKQLGSKWRVVDKSGSPARDKAGGLIDTGGFNTESQARKRIDTHKQRTAKVK